MSRSLRAATAVTVFALVMCIATTAFAATAVWESVDVTLHSETEGGVMVIAGNLPASAKLPAQIQLSVPPGAPVLWMGEVLGGALNNDPTLDPVKSETAFGADVYSATLTKSRTAQIEVETTGAVATGASSYTAAMSWASAADVPQVTLSVRVPTDATILQPADGATLYPSNDGFSYYAKTFQQVKAGQVLSLAFAYSATATAAGGSAAAAPAATDNSGLITVLLVVLVLVALGLVAMAVASSRGPRGGGGAEGSSAGAGPDAAEDDADGAGTEGDDEDTEAADDAGEDPDAEAPPRSPGSRRLMAITAGLAVVFLSVAVVVGIVAAQPRVANGAITQTFSGGEACTTSRIALSVPAGGAASATGDKLFAALKPVAGVISATYDVAGSTLEVGFCESTTSETALRAALAPTGLVPATAGSGAAVPAP